MTSTARGALRWIDAGEVTPLRSQALYHGIAHAFTESTPDTIVVCTPKDPYVCLGFHQDLHVEVDVDYCTSRGLPIIRREVGGGTVYIDRDQVFLMWIFGSTSLPVSIDRRFQLFFTPLIETYRELGIEAEIRPVNDLHVRGRKICGTGAGRLGQGEVLVGNLLFDFDIDRMARILQVPSPAFRTQIERSLRRHLTTIHGELADPPSPSTIQDRYRFHCHRALDRPVDESSLTEEELRSIESVERRFASLDFLHEDGGLHRPGVKIHEDVWVKEVVMSLPSGSTRITAELKGEVIGELHLEGGEDERWFKGLEQAALGHALHSDGFERSVREYVHRHPSRSPATEDWVAALRSLDDPAKALAGRKNRFD